MKRQRYKRGRAAKVDIRMTPDLKAKIKALATAEGVTVSRWIATRIKRAAERGE